MPCDHEVIMSDCFWPIALHTSRVFMQEHCINTAPLCLSTRSVSRWVRWFWSRGYPCCWWATPRHLDSKRSVKTSCCLWTAVQCASTGPWMPVSWPEPCCSAWAAAGWRWGCCWPPALKAAPRKSSVCISASKSGSSRSRPPFIPSPALPPRERPRCPSRSPKCRASSPERKPDLLSAWCFRAEQNNSSWNSRDR